MFVTEDLALEYFYEKGEPLSLKDLMEKFDNSTYEDAFEVVKILEGKNFIDWVNSPYWIITDIGIKHYKKNILKVPERSYKAATIVLTAIGIILTALSLIQLKGCKVPFHN